MKKVHVDVESPLVSNVRIYCFDIDGVICNDTWRNYQEAKPYKKAIDKINDLYQKVTE